MSVILTLSVSGDPHKLEEHAASDPGAMKAILESAKRHGLIAHRLYGSGTRCTSTSASKRVR